jgi:hypothetical protein
MRTGFRFQSPAAEGAGTSGELLCQRHGGGANRRARKKVAAVE